MKKNIIILLFLLVSSLGAQDFKTVLEEAFKETSNQESKTLATFIVDQYNGDVSRLTKDSFDFAIENQNARTVLNGFWRDVVVDRGTRYYLLEKLLIGNTKETDTAWQLLSLSDQNYTLTEDGYMSVYPKISEENVLKNDIPLEYKVYLYKQDPEQAIHLLKEEFSKSEKEIIEVFKKHQRALGDTEKYAIWKDDVSPFVINYLQDEPNPAFVEYLIFKVGSIYRSPENAKANNQELFDILQSILDSRIINVLTQCYISEEQKTSSDELDLWLNNYKSNLETKVSPPQNSQNYKGLQSERIEKVLPKSEQSEKQKTNTTSLWVMLLGLTLIVVLSFTLLKGRSS